jgi:Fic family protein
VRAPAPVKERYQEIDDKNESLRELFAEHPKAREFLDRFEMSWVYHDNALEGVVYAPPELQAALHPDGPPDASMVPAVLDIRNQKAAIDYIREEAKSAGRKQSAVSMAVIKRIHDLLLGNTPEAQAARASAERRERTEKELTKERDRAGLRRDMPLHRTYFHDIAQPAKIPALLEKLVEFTGSTEFREYHPIKQAATFQFQFLQIFPFSEHSGKVGRMASNLILQRHGYLPCVIHSIDRQRYYEAFRGTPSTFRTLLMDAMENSLDNGLKFFRDQARRYRAIN